MRLLTRQQNLISSLEEMFIQVLNLQLMRLQPENRVQSPSIVLYSHIRALRSDVTEMISSSQTKTISKWKIMITPAVRYRDIMLPSIQNTPSVMQSLYLQRSRSKQRQRAALAVEHLSLTRINVSVVVSVQRSVSLMRSSYIENCLDAARWFQVKIS